MSPFEIRRQKAVEHSRSIQEKVRAGKTLQEIADEEGITKQRVWALYYYTEAVDIQQEKDARRWTPEMLALLGILSDAEIARRMGISDYCVRAKRNLLGIVSARQRPGPRKNHVGERHGRLRIIRGERVEGKPGFRWVCECDCGKITKPLEYSNIKKVQACGCVRDKMYRSGGTRKWKKRP